MIYFLNQFKLLGNNYSVENESLVRKLPEYYKSGIQKKVKAQSSYIINNWDQLYQ